MNFNEYLDGLFAEYDQNDLPESSNELTIDECHRLAWLYLEEEKKSPFSSYEEDFGSVLLKMVSKAFGESEGESLPKILLADTFSSETLITTLNATSISQHAFEANKLWIDEKIWERLEGYEARQTENKYYSAMDDGYDSYTANIISQIFDNNCKTI